MAVPLMVYVVSSAAAVLLLPATVCAAQTAAVVPCTAQDTLTLWVAAAEAEPVDVALEPYWMAEAPSVTVRGVWRLPQPAELVSRTDIGQATWKQVAVGFAEMTETTGVTSAARL